MELESSLGRGDIGQASWLTLPAIILILTALFNWDKVSPLVTNAASNIERMVVARKSVSPSRSPQVDMSEDDINKAVKFVEQRNGPKKAKVKPTHYTG